VLFMTLPGLALFYGGLVRARNIPLRISADDENAGLDLATHGERAYDHG
jgi:ammonia channel protein AmtB